MDESYDLLRLNNMVFYGYHGIENSEKELGQRFEVDVDLFLDLRRAGRSDKLTDTIDYTRIYQIVEELVVEKEYNLIEALADEIARAILAEFEIAGTVVRVRKPNVQLRGIADGVEVEIQRP